MLQKGIISEDAVTGVLTPDLIADMKKEDMKQAIAERFSYRAKAKTMEVRKPRSPYWQPVDEEC
jgi:hypothetical protein